MAVKWDLTESVRDGLLALLDPMLAAGSDRIADGCNGESSWGGYVANSERGRASVHATARSAKDAARAQRLLRNLDKGRPQ